MIVHVYKKGLRCNTMFISARSIQLCQGTIEMMESTPITKEEIHLHTSKVKDDLNQPAKANEVERVECHCCGMSEDCTPTYIGRIREFHCGNWICGLCAEAVKEKKKKAPSMAMEEALESHMALCKQFNRTIRLKPELSFVGTMRDIARKSFQYRASHGSYAPKIARTSSCGPKVNGWIDEPPKIARTSSCGPKVDAKIESSSIP